MGDLSLLFGEGVVSEEENEEKCQSKSGEEMLSPSMGQKCGMDQGSRVCRLGDLHGLVVSFSDQFPHPDIAVMIWKNSVGLT